jgi:hypothetical protein
MSVTRWMARRKGIPEGPVMPTRHPTHAWPKGQVKRVIQCMHPTGRALARQPSGMPSAAPSSSSICCSP